VCSFAENWTSLEFVQEVLGQSPRGHNLVLLDKLKNSKDRICYSKKTIENNRSRNNLKSSAFLSLGFSIT
jgi:predicted nuclease of restriction endonuclease-like (RecB) superfamily